MTIFIFGDSYSIDYEYPHYYNGETGQCWTDIIREKYDEDVVNHSYGGSGPYFSFKKFYEAFEEGHIKENDKIIFMLSSQYRLDFLGVNPGDQSLLPIVLNGKSRKTVQHFGVNFSQIAYDVQLSHQTFAEEIYRCNIKNIFFLKNLSQLKNLQTIVFLCFDHNHDNDIIHDRIILNDHYINYNKLNDEKFKLFDKFLYSICINENTYRVDSDISDNQRANHLSWKNHKILANVITNFFSNTNLSEKFYEDIISIKTETERFIYE